MLLTPTTLTTFLLAASAVSAVPFGFSPNPIHAPAGHTIATTVTKTATVTSGITSTTYAFKRGNPPAKLRRSNPLNERTPQVTSAVLSIAADFGISPLPSTTTQTFTTTVTTTTTLPTVTETVYPCSNSSILYGTASSSPAAITGTQNSLHGLDTPQGADVQGCCNTCLFDMENCVQAWWYFYEGCVVQQAVNVTESDGNVGGNGESEQCPQGVIEGLTYGNDTDPAFRSTGNIVGPCGMSYIL